MGASADFFVVRNGKNRAKGTIFGVTNVFANLQLLPRHSTFVVGDFI